MEGFACSNFAGYGGQLTEMVLLKWDGVTMEFDNPEANQFLHKTYREGWSLVEGAS